MIEFDLQAFFFWDVLKAGRSLCFIICACMDDSVLYSF